MHVWGFIHSIGLRGWTEEEVLKLFVLMIYDGIPKDIIVFANGRVEHLIVILSLLGTINLMIAR